MKDRWIRNRREYQVVYSNGLKRVGKHVVIFVFPTGRQETRFGITVTRKIGKAVIRNRMKRILREVIRKNFREWKGGIDLIFVAKKEVIQASFHDIEDDIVGLLRKVSQRIPLPPIPA